MGVGVEALRRGGGAAAGSGGRERAPGQDLCPVCAEGLGGERSTGKNVGQWLSAGEKAGEVGSRPPSLQSGTTLLPQVLTKQLHSRTCAFFFV